MKRTHSIENTFYRTFERPLLLPRDELADVREVVLLGQVQRRFRGV
jgi:hypothetical protein